MADELDKFVLKYEVKVRDAIKQLESLDARMRNVEKTSKASSGGLKGFSNDVRETAGEVKSLGSSVGSLASGFSRVAPGIAASAAAFLALQRVISLVNAEMKSLNEQTALGLKIGTGGLQVEQFQRSMSNASGGRIRGAESRSILENIGRMSYSAYVDPMQNNDAARRLRYVGVNINDKNGRLKSADVIAADLSERLAKARREEAYALGQVVGLDYKQVDALRALGKAGGDLSNMTEGQAKQYIAASKAAQELDGAYGSLDESMREIKQTIAQEFLPVFADVMEQVAKGVKFLGGSLDKLKQNSDAAAGGNAAEGNFLVNLSKGVMGALQKGGSASDIVTNIGKAVTDATNKANEALSENTKNQQRVSDETKEAARKVAEQQYKTAGLFDRSIQSFAGAVSSFTAATVDSERAWAAWAGEIAGGSGAGAAFTPAQFNQNAYDRAYGAGASSAAGQGSNSSQYDPMILSVAKKFGLDPVLLKQVISAESNFNPNAVSKAGAIGLGQIMPANAKKLGINPYDPAQNIAAAGYLLSENMKQFGNTDDALRAYNAGWNRAKWSNRETAQYVDRVKSQNVSISGKASNVDPFPYSPAQNDAWNADAQGTWKFRNNGNPYGSGDTSFKGESRRTVRAFDLAAGPIASIIGIPKEQLLQGQVSRGDVGFAAGEAMTGLVNQIAALKQQMTAPGLMPRQHGEMQRQLQELEMNRQALSENAGFFIDNARAGGREATVGQARAPVVNMGGVNINVNGAQDPHAVGQAIREELGSHWSGIVNDHSRALFN